MALVRAADRFLVRTTVLQPWLCGGPLVNLEDKAIGRNIARAGCVTTYAPPAKLATRILENLTSTSVPATGAGQ